MVVYKINCEWDCDELTDNLYTSREAALKAMKEYDWENLVEDSLESLLEANLISIQKVKVMEE